MLLNYTQSGTGNNLVLLHGLFGSLDNLAQLAKHMSNEFQVTSIDLRNHGGSRHDDEHNYIAMAKDLLETLAYLKIEKCHLFGHSMGGKTAMAFALLYPEKVTSLIIEDISPVCYPNRHNDVFEALTSLDLAQLQSRNQAVHELDNIIKNIGISQFLAKNLQRDGNRWLWKINLPALQQAYPEISKFPQSIGQAYQAKTLFIKGMQSDYITAAHQNEILQRFPNAKVKVIQGSGHWIHAEKPNIFNKIVADFLQKQEC